MDIGRLCERLGLCAEDLDGSHIDSRLPTTLRHRRCAIFNLDAPAQVGWLHHVHQHVNHTVLLINWRAGLLRSTGWRVRPLVPVFLAGHHPRCPIIVRCIEQLLRTAQRSIETPQNAQSVSGSVEKSTNYQELDVGIGFANGGVVILLWRRLGATCGRPTAMPIQTLSECAGSSVLVLLTFLMKDMRPLRITVILSNIAFIIYGALQWLPPVIGLHVLLLPINLARLIELHRAGRKGQPHQRSWAARSPQSCLGCATEGRGAGWCDHW